LVFLLFFFAPCPSSFFLLIVFVSSLLPILSFFLLFLKIFWLLWFQARS
jgi:hypothetical protein